MAVLDMFRRGWGWVWVLGLAELALVGAEALPLLHPAPLPRSDAQPAVQPAPQPADSPAQVSLQPILDFHPFGAPDMPAPVTAEPAPAPEAPPAVPVTEGYVLQGVLFRDDGVPSRAILAWQGGSPGSYTLGDTLPGGATLAGVEANRVWLEKDGDKQFLEFPVSGGALQDSSGSDLPAQPLTDGEATPQPDAPPAPQPNRQIMPQPDLRNLIPGLVATPPGQG